MTHTDHEVMLYLDLVWFLATLDVVPNSAYREVFNELSFAAEVTT